MKREWFHRTFIGVPFLVLLLTASAAWGQYWVSFDDDTRYMALGDSLSAGYGAHPATQGFVYQLYQSGVIDNVNNLLFCNTGVPNATSSDVLTFQVPQVGLFFADTGKTYSKVITMTVGSNDLLKILDGADPNVVIPELGMNLATILGQLASAFPTARIYVANLYDPMLSVPGEDLLIATANQVIGGVVQHFPNATLVDVFSAFEGRSGLLLSERRGAGFQVHPTNAGYKVMEQAFADAIRGQ